MKPNSDKTNIILMLDAALLLLIAGCTSDYDNQDQMSVIFTDIEYLIERMKNGSKSENHG